jgi:eukaryotic-like serine/threonine-protein kinase
MTSSRPARAPASAAPPDSEQLGDEGERGSYQRRLGVTFGAMAGVLLVFYLVGSIAIVATVEWRSLLLTPTRVAELARLPLLVVATLVCRGQKLPAATLAAVEVAVTFGFMALGAVPVALEPSEKRFDLHGMLFLLLMLLLRAGLLPASPPRALVVSTVAAVPLIAGAGVHFALSPLDDWQPAATALGTSVVWSLAAIGAAMIVARTLQALRADVKSARRLGQYTLQEKIGEGGMGSVYRAKHTLLRRPAAIKLLLPGRAQESDLARFEREVQMTSRLTHPNTVSIFDYGRTDDGSFYYVMEYLEGVDLDRLVKQSGPLAPPRVIHILAQVCGALSEAHLLGLIHRDIKPANIILTERVDEPDVVKVVDFGLVREVTPAQSEAVTQDNALIGTPGYLAPETMVGTPADARADIYAVGAVGYFLLTGRHVFRGSNLLQILQKHLTERPLRPSTARGSAVSEDLEDLILACLEREPAERPPSAADLRTQLLACADAALYDRADALRWWRERASPPPEVAGEPAGLSATVPLLLNVRRGPDAEA